MSILFENSFDKLPGNFYSKIKPEKIKKAKKIVINSSLCKDLNIDYNYLNSEEGIKVLSGNLIPNSASPLAMVYAGHQFGNWVPQLGDGRAVLLGELLNKNMQRFDVQLKGSGKTPYSRGGDGKAWLGPVIREYIVSEYMNKINIPSTRSLSAILTNENIYREQVYPGAILCRVARSHIRVGTFQYFHSKKDVKSLKILADYFIDRNLAHLKDDSDKYYNFFKSVVNDQVKLVTLWMKAGFIHGVMNTDNTSISCETIDYGPCAFMDIYKGNKVFSSIDSMGRYSYKNQPNIIMWNMACFASTILPLLKGDIKCNTERLQEVIAAIPVIYKENWLKQFSKKLGLNKSFKIDEKIISDFLEILEEEKLDFTNSFRDLSKLKSKNDNEVISVTPRFLEWKKMWVKRGEEEESPRRIYETIKKTNPKLIVRNHVIEKIIKDLLKNDRKNLDRILKAIEAPFEEKAQYKDFYALPNKEEEVTQTFCGT